MQRCGGQASDGGQVGMVDDHQSPVWGIERILERQDDIELLASAPTVNDLLAVVSDLDVVILDLRLNDGTTPRENVNRLAEQGIVTVVYTSGSIPTCCVRRRVRGPWRSC